jgi:hypothetical protein
MQRVCQGLPVSPDIMPDAGLEWLQAAAQTACVPDQEVKVPQWQAEAGRWTVVSMHDGQVPVCSAHRHAAAAVPSAAPSVVAVQKLAWPAECSCLTAYVQAKLGTWPAFHVELMDPSGEHTLLGAYPLDGLDAQGAPLPYPLRATTSLDEGPILSTCEPTCLDLWWYAAGWLACVLCSVFKCHGTGLIAGVRCRLPWLQISMTPQSG